MKRSIAISLDQLFRPQPGGIATYVRGLVSGLAALEDAPRLYGLAPRGEPVQAIDDLALEVRRVSAGVGVLTRVWGRWPLGVPRLAQVVHATTLAGPFAGGARGAVHSVAVHDLLWRDEPTASTAAGVRFHERRLRGLLGRADVRVITTAPGLAARLLAEGFDGGRLFESRLGVDDDATVVASAEEVRDFLASREVRGAYTLYAGTREPRKNLERLVRAHQRARAEHPELGPLVMAGPAGWGEVDVGDAAVVGLVSRPLLKGLLRDATVVAYVPRAEGFGLPPVEALRAGARVVASTTTPSVAENREVVHVDPLDVDAIARGLSAALALVDDESARARRRASVANLTWHQVALDHLAAWR